MAKIDLEKYKSAWKKEQTFDEATLSESEIQSFMRSASKHILSLFKRGLLFDLAFKGILLAVFLPLAFLMPYSAGWIGLWLVLTGCLAGGMAWQVRTIRRIPHPDQGALSALDLLRQYIAFYDQHYYHALFVAAFSSIFVFLIGSLYYFFFKYGEVPPVQIDDLLVLGLGLILSFSLSAFAQVKQGNFQIQQLKEQVKEIEAHTLSPGSLEKYRSQKTRNLILLAVALIVGLLLLLYFTF